MVRAARAQASLAIHVGRFSSRQMPIQIAVAKVTTLNQILSGASLPLKAKVA